MLPLALWDLVEEMKRLAPSEGQELSKEWEVSAEIRMGQIGPSVVPSLDGVVGMSN